MFLISIPFLIFYLSFAQACDPNFQYVQNGDFQTPHYTGYFSVNNVALNGWTSKNNGFNLQSRLGMVTQYIDLEGFGSGNGYIQQKIFIKDQGNYNLTWNQKAYNSSYISYIPQIVWDGSFIASFFPQTTNITLQTLKIQVLIPNQNHTLRFQEIGFPNSIGIYIDNVSIKCIPKVVEPPPQSYMKKYDSQQFNITCKQISTAASVTQTSRMINQGLQALSMMVDDLQLYGYHNHHYPDSFNFFIKKTELINQANVFSDSLEKFTWYLKVRNKNWEINYNGNSLNRIQTVYFFEAAKMSLIQSFLLTFSIFSVSKVLHLILFLASKKQIRWVMHLYKKVKEATRWWTIIIGILEINIAQLSFMSVLQMLSAYHYEFANKTNFLFATLTLFFTLSYCLLFYSLVYAFQTRTNSKHLLTRSKFFKRSFIFESITFVSRSYIRGFFTALFFYAYGWLITCLAVVDISAIIFVVTMSRYFKKKQLFSYTLFYFALLACLDIYFLIEHFNPALVASSNRQLFCIIIILFMIFVALSYAFVQSFLDHFSCILKIEKFGHIKKKQKKLQNQPSWLKDNKIHAADNIIGEKFGQTMPTMKINGQADAENIKTKKPKQILIRNL